jgi:hypothetical protein
VMLITSPRASGQARDEQEPKAVRAGNAESCSRDDLMDFSFQREKPGQELCPGC